KKRTKLKLRNFCMLLDALEIYNTFKFDNPDDNLKLEVVQEKFRSYCNPRKNVTYERHVFFTRNQNTNETIN
ncbi:MAG: hypothetical protein AB2705_19015, partial [Candidatus Thiodiazotropha sp.]